MEEEAGSPVERHEPLGPVFLSCARTCGIALAQLLFAGCGDTVPGDRSVRTPDHVTTAVAAYRTAIRTSIKSLGPDGCHEMGRLCVGPAGCSAVVTSVALGPHGRYLCATSKDNLLGRTPRALPY